MERFRDSFYFPGITPHSGNVRSHWTQEEENHEVFVAESADSGGELIAVYARGRTDSYECAHSDGESFAVGAGGSRARKRSACPRGGCELLGAHNMRLVRSAYPRGGCKLLGAHMQRAYAESGARDSRVRRKNACPRGRCELLLGGKACVSSMSRRYGNIDGIISLVRTVSTMMMSVRVVGVLFGIHWS
jgi:hypothetical protein